MIDDLGCIRKVKIGAHDYVVVDTLNMFDKVKESIDFVLTRISSRFYVIDTDTHLNIIYDPFITAKTTQILSLTCMRFVIDSESDIGKSIIKIYNLEMI